MRAVSLRPVGALGRRVAVAAQTLRFRLTVLYGSLFLLCGAALVGITYFLARHAYTVAFFLKSSGGGAVSSSTRGLVTSSVGVAGHAQITVRISGVGAVPVIVALPPGTAPTHAQVLTAGRQASLAGLNESNAAVHQLLINSGIALAVMALLSIWLGWLIAGRALRPLRTITATAEQISASNLHRRLALSGPNDELRRLAKTFDGLLERLEASFAAQRQFAANASHELRTPLTLERTLIEVALADPDATIDTFRETCARLLASGEQQERLIEALLTLSRSQRGLDVHEPFDLARLARAALAARADDIRRRALVVSERLEPAPSAGDPRLVERLVANLIDNAIAHNHHGGRVELETATTPDGRAVISVTNSGPVVLTDAVEELFEPFHRADDDQRHGAGFGLGLSIVRAVALAHHATATATAQPSGGLTVRVVFPRAATRGEGGGAPDQPFES